MITFHDERFEDVIDEAMPLLRRHWEEIALNKDTVPLDPDIERYKQISSIGMLHITTARDGGDLIGYAAYFIMPNLHYRSVIVGETDIFWLAPEYRKGMVGARLLKTAETHLINKGVNTVVSKVKISHDVGALFERLGYTAIERIYMKKV
jgi:GNAT superfamily N-acetyltransferase